MGKIEIEEKLLKSSNEFKLFDRIAESNDPCHILLISNHLRFRLYLEKTALENCIFHEPNFERYFVEAQPFCRKKTQYQEALDSLDKIYPVLVEDFNNMYILQNRTILEKIAFLMQNKSEYVKEIEAFDTDTCFYLLNFHDIKSEDRLGYLQGNSYIDSETFPFDYFRNHIVVKNIKPILLKETYLMTEIQGSGHVSQTLAIEDSYGNLSNNNVYYKSEVLNHLTELQKKKELYEKYYLSFVDSLNEKDLEKLPKIKE
jgi:hypothetical protein